MRSVQIKKIIGFLNILCLLIACNSLTEEYVNENIESKFLITSPDSLQRFLHDSTSIKNSPIRGIKVKLKGQEEYFLLSTYSTSTPELFYKSKQNLYVLKKKGANWEVISEIEDCYPGSFQDVYYYKNVFCLYEEKYDPNQNIFIQKISEINKGKITTTEVIKKTENYIKVPNEDFFTILSSSDSIVSGELTFDIKKFFHYKVNSSSLNLFNNFPSFNLPSKTKELSSKWVENNSVLENLSNIKLDLENYKINFIEYPEGIIRPEWQTVFSNEVYSILIEKTNDTQSTINLYAYDKTQNKFFFILKFKDLAVNKSYSIENGKKNDFLDYKFKLINPSLLYFQLPFIVPKYIVIDLINEEFSIFNNDENYNLYRANSYFF